MTDLLHHELLSFPFELATLKDLRRSETFWDLAREARLPEALHKLRRDLVMHRLDHLGGRDCFCVRKVISKQLKAEVMVAVGVSDIDCDQVLSARDNPLEQVLRVVRGKKGIDQHCIATAVDERYRVGHPCQMFFTRR